MNRIGFLGGSDVAGILNLSPWTSRYSEWTIKVGIAESHIDDERLAIGTDAEPFLANVFRRHNPHLYLAGAQVELTHPDYPIFRGHADGLIYETDPTDNDDAEPVAGWEAKTDRSLAKWDEVPAYYCCQAQLYMLLSGLPEWRFTVGFGAWNVEHYTVPADPQDQALIVKECTAFWNDHVLTGIPPEVDGHDATTEALKSIDADSDAEHVNLDTDPVVAMALAQIPGCKARIKNMEAELAEHENRVRLALGPATEGRSDFAKVTWREQSTTRLDTKALTARMPRVAARFSNTTTGRVLRVTPTKEK